MPFRGACLSHLEASVTFSTAVGPSSCWRSWKIRLSCCWVSCMETWRHVSLKWVQRQIYRYRLSAPNPALDVPMAPLWEISSAVDAPPSFCDMGNAIKALIAQASGGGQRDEECVLLSEEHSLLLTCCWVSLKVGIRIQRQKEGFPYRKLMPSWFLFLFIYFRK